MQLEEAEVASTSSVHRVSEISGETFGRYIARRPISTLSDPVVAETFADLDRIRAELLDDNIVLVKRAPEHLVKAKARVSASGVSSSEGHGIDSDEVITAHLLRAAANNDRCIVPADPDTPIGRPGKDGFPPDLDRAQPPNGSHSPRSPRLVNKVDQILGRGAFEAGMSMEQERRILREALAGSVIG